MAASMSAPVTPRHSDDAVVPVRHPTVSATDIRLIVARVYTRILWEYFAMGLPTFMVWRCLHHEEHGDEPVNPLRQPADNPVSRGRAVAAAVGAFVQNGIVCVLSGVDSPTKDELVRAFAGHDLFLSGEHAVVSARGSGELVSSHPVAGPHAGGAAPRWPQVRWPLWGRQPAATRAPALYAPGVPAVAAHMCVRVRGVYLWVCELPAAGAAGQMARFLGPAFAAGAGVPALAVLHAPGGMPPAFLRLGPAPNRHGVVRLPLLPTRADRWEGAFYPACGFLAKGASWSPGTAAPLGDLLPSRRHPSNSLQILLTPI